MSFAWNGPQTCGQHGLAGDEPAGALQQQLEDAPLGRRSRTGALAARVTVFADEVDPHVAERHHGRVVVARRAGGG